MGPVQAQYPCVAVKGGVNATSTRLNQTASLYNRIEGQSTYQIYQVNSSLHRYHLLLELGFS